MSTRTLLTAEEFLAIPGDEPHELAQGEVVEMTLPGGRHGLVCARIARLLGNWADSHEAGEVLSNDSAVITERDPDSVRGPDVQFFSIDRLPDDFPPVGPLRQPPDLAIEVVSDSDRWSDVINKVDEFLGVGVREVWVIEPEGQFVEIFRPDGCHRRIRRDGTLESPTIVPGFACPVASLFTIRRKKGTT